MLQLSFPTPQFKIRGTGSGTELFDPLRKKWLKITPEEWVRQKLVDYFMKQHQVPPALIALERKLNIAGMSRRFDVVIYKRSMQPWLLLECKAETVQLSGQVLSQSLSYLSIVQSDYFMISNGLYHYAWKRSEDGSAIMQNQLPAFPG